jgi:hypothetical protein
LVGEQSAGLGALHGVCSTCFHVVVRPSSILQIGWDVVIVLINVSACQGLRLGIEYEQIVLIYVIIM